MNSQKRFRIAIVGCGYWARFQIPAWLEIEGIEIVALYNRTISRAESLARQYNIPNCYDNAEELLLKEHPDCVDIITDVDTHEYFTLLAAKYGVPVICQKPMASELQSANNMLESCRSSGVPFFIHENFRWQAPLRKLKEIMDNGIIGTPFKARVSFCSAFPVFDNQPFLAELDKFILTDIGSHILDTCRYLFGEAKSLYCLTKTVNPAIKGEDVANVMMQMENGLHCFAEMSYASIMETESFPQTLALIEGSKGTLQLCVDAVIKITTAKGTNATNCEIKMYDWLDPAYAVVHSSIVDCNRNILSGMRGGFAETTGADNFETVKLVWAAYASSRDNSVIDIKRFGI